MINCPCGYANNLPDDTERCGVCGMNLLPVSKLKLLYKKYYENGLFLYNNKKMDEAISQVTISLDLKDDYLRSYLLLSKIYLEKKEYLKSAYILKKALSFDEGNQEILKQINTFQKKTRKKEILTCSRSIALDLVFTVLFFTLAFIMFNTDINENNQNAVVLQNTKILNGTHDIVNRDKTNYFTYSIQKNETLSKISIKFFGNSKFEDKIYELNKTLLHDKNRIREGIKIKIPVE